jgi:DNA-binding LacI/PurR family transcriptional regulator
VPDIANPFFPTVVKAAQARALELDCAVLLGDTDEDPVAEVELIRTLAKQVDGFLLCAARAPADELRSISDGMPVVMLNRRVGQIPSVCFDSFDGARQAVAHLAVLGHRRIAFIAGLRTSWVNGERSRGVRTAAAAAGVELVKVGNVSPTFDGGVAAADAVVAAGVTAVVAYNDMVALGVLGRLRARGVRVPGEISLVGFDDIPISELVDPPLTTVGGPKKQLGRAGIDLLTAVLQDRPPPDGNPRMLPTQLIVRQSTTAPPS